MTETALPGQNNWQIIEEDFQIEEALVNETLFSLGNGYLGMRGTFEEGLGRSALEGTYINGLYETADILIEGDNALQQGIRFNMFHLLQSAGRNGRSNIAAKRLTGLGYEGHYFWDTEIYILPFFSYTHPEIGRKLLEYRYRILERPGNGLARCPTLAARSMPGAPSIVGLSLGARSFR